MKHSASHILTLAAAALLVSASALHAQNTNPPSSSMASDKSFIKMADEGNTAEITASQIALKKSHNDDVKAYATKMITDHQKLRSDMAPLAQQFGVMTPQPLNPTHKAQDARLSQLSGTRFDKEYIKNMDADHHKTLGMFNNEIATTANPDVKSAAQMGKPVIAQHTDMADQLAMKMGVPTIPTPGGDMPSPSGN